MLILTPEPGDETNKEGDFQAGSGEELKVKPRIFSDPAGVKLEVKQPDPDRVFKDDLIKKTGGAISFLKIIRVFEKEIELGGDPIDLRQGLLECRFSGRVDDDCLGLKDDRAVFLDS